MHIQYYFQVILSIKQKVYSYREGFRNHKVYKIQSIREDNSKKELRPPPHQRAVMKVQQTKIDPFSPPLYSRPHSGWFLKFFFSPSIRPLNGRCILKFTRYDPQIVLYRRIQRKVTACWLLSAETQARHQVKKSLFFISKIRKSVPFVQSPPPCVFFRGKN